MDGVYLLLSSLVFVGWSFFFSLSFSNSSRTPHFNYTCACASGSFLVDGRHCQTLPGLTPGQTAGLGILSLHSSLLFAFAILCSLLVVGLLLLLLLATLLFTLLFRVYSYLNSELHLLPKEISWSLLDYKKYVAMILILA
jgi:hypothetical protein